MSIKDVAREAGVSVTTVSHALNDKGRLNSETRQRVREVAARLGYRPNPAARSLVSGRTGLIALVASLPSGSRANFGDYAVFGEIIGAATRVSVERDFALVVAPFATGSSLWDRVPLDGVIVISPLQGEPVVPLLRERRLPFVTIGRDLAGHERDAVVSSDEVASTREVLDHLETSGAQRPALLTLPPVYSYSRDMLASHQGWCSERGAPVLAETFDLDELVRDRTAAVAAAVDRLFDRAPVPDAVFCPVELFGIAAALAIGARGLRIPDDVLFVTSNDAGLASAFDPPLTSLDADLQELGRAATTMLLDLVEGRRKPPCLDIVPTKLEVRASTTR
jgi:DNA-binding LacI/PurR family transcriptional regulator